MADEAYDALALFLLEYWKTLKHRHKHLVTRADLKAGTLYCLKDEDYPNIVKSATNYFILKTEKRNDRRRRRNRKKRT